MNRFELLNLLQETIQNELVICNIGLPSQELYKINDQPNYFYMLGSMGLASSIGLGLSLSIDKNKAWHVRKPLNLELMKKGAKKLLGTNDYSTFRSSSCNAKSPIKTIKSIKIKSSINKIEFQFSSQSFLQHQVRSIVGCLKYLGEKKWDLKTFEKRFNLKKRTLCAPPAPPGGLFLFKVLY